MQKVSLSLDNLTVKGTVKIFINGKLFKTLSNTFQTTGLNYLRNALTDSGSFSPVDAIELYYGTGTNSDTPTISKTANGKARFYSTWSSGTEYLNITELRLKSGSDVYSRIPCHFSKESEYRLEIVWDLEIST